MVEYVYEFSFNHHSRGTPGVDMGSIILKEIIIFIMIHNNHHHITSMNHHHLHHQYRITNLSQFLLCCVRISTPQECYVNELHDGSSSSCIFFNRKLSCRFCRRINAIFFFFHTSSPFLTFSHTTATCSSSTSSQRGSVVGRAKCCWVGGGAH